MSGDQDQADAASIEKLAAASKEGLRRLQTGLAYLRTVNSARLDMCNWYSLTETWRQKAEEENKGLFDFDLDAKAPHCGTIACAFGWMSFCPELQAEGLMPNRNAPPSWHPYYDGFRVASRFFAITEKQATAIFGVPSNELSHAENMTPGERQRLNTDMAAAIDRIVSLIEEIEADPKAQALRLLQDNW